MQSKKDILFARKDTQGKTHWMRVGMLIVKDNGKTSIKLDVIPVGFDGWLSIGEDERTNEPTEKAF